MGAEILENLKNFEGMLCGIRRSGVPFSVKIKHLKTPQETVKVIRLCLCAGATHVAVHMRELHADREKEPADWNHFL